jgi:hypothetical protein
VLIDSQVFLVGLRDLVDSGLCCILLRSDVPCSGLGSTRGGSGDVRLEYLLSKMPWIPESTLGVVPPSSDWLFPADVPVFVEAWLQWTVSLPSPSLPTFVGWMFQARRRQKVARQKSVGDRCAVEVAARQQR